jgi:multidrug efflux system outer membrane protein
VVSSIATGWLAYAADTSLLKLAHDTETAAKDSVQLTKKRVDGGVAPLGDLRKAEITLRQAQSDIASQTNARPPISTRCACWWATTSIRPTCRSA